MKFKITEEMYQGIDTITNRYNFHTLAEKAKEELEELKEAIESNNDMAIVDEVADVIIVSLEQIAKRGIDIDVMERITYKIQRQIGRMKAGL